MKEKKFMKGITKRLFSIVLALTMVFTLIPMNVTEVKAADPELEPTLVETIYSTKIDDAGRWIFGKEFKVTSYHKFMCEDGAYYWHMVSDYSTLDIESVKGKVFSKLVLHLVSPYSDTRLRNLPSYAEVTFSADKKTITISNLRETSVEIATYSHYDHAEVKSVDIYSGPCPLSHVDGQEPTCEKDGWNDYYQCTDPTCRKIYATDVPVGTSYSSLDKWKVSPEGKLDAIGHDFSYSLETTNTEKDTIKATCSHVDKCDLTTADKSISLVLSTKDKYYDGYNYTGDELGGTGKWYELGLQIPRVKYVGRGDTIYSESEMRPREVGTYTAKIAAGDPEVTATADFEIKKLPADAAPLCYCLNPAHVNHYYTFSDGLGFYVYNGTTYNRTETKAITQMTSPTYAFVKGTIEPDKWYYKSEGVYVPGGVCEQSAAPLHTHKWNYKSDGDTMYAYCTENEGIEYCVYQGTSEDLTKAISYTITTDARGFTGIDNIDSFNKATKLDLSENDVKFYKVETEGETTGGEDVTGTSLKEGFYYAALSIENQTAVKAFSLAKDAPKPLTFKASEASTIKFKTAQFTGVKYNKNGSGWTKYTSEEVINLNADEYVQFKGNCTSIPTMSSYAQFTMSGKIEASGDITSLIDNNGGGVSLASVGASSGMSNGVFYKLFQNCTSLTKAPNLPSTELGNACYSELFSGCTELTEAPELPATTVPGSCYRLMFSGCTNLTATPNLPATTIDDYCYVSMFSGCTNLTTVPESLPATTLAKSCYASMFSGCTKITTAPVLPATTAAHSCYQQMFSGCTNLAKAPELPATTLNTYCYWSMFEGCEALTEAPELPAATMEDRCYNSMFKGCARLKKAPELPATTLASECYAQMFSECTGLTNVPELPAPTLASYCYSSMFNGCTSIELKETKVMGSHETEWIINATSDNEYWYQNMFRDCPKVEIGETPALNTKYYQRGASHSHNFKYSVPDDSKNILVATCTNEDGECTLDDGSAAHEHKVSLTLSAEDKDYSGTPATITVGSSAEIEAWENAGLTVPTTIYYEKADGTNLRTHAPADSGSYVAKVCPEGNMPREIDTARASFTIAKIESIATVPTAKAGLVYTGAAQELVTAGSTTCGTLQYALSPDGTFSEAIPKGTNAGSYNVYYKVVGDANHNDKAFVTPVATTISKATYTGTKTATGNVRADYASSDIEVILPVIPDHMAYGTLSYSAPFTSATIENGKVKYSVDNTVVVGSNYTITVPVSEKSGERANYNDYNITVTLTGTACPHSSTTHISEVGATCTADGCKEYYKCLDTTCNKLFADGACTTEITDLEAWKAGDGKIAALGHDWKYSVAENKIEAYCAHTGCPSGTSDSHKVSLTLNADSAVYSATDTYAASLVGTEAWTIAGLTAPEIKYYKATAEGGTEGTDVVASLTGLAEGNYYAAITVGGATAKKAFRIANEEDLFAEYKIIKKTEAEGLKLEKDLEAIKTLIDEAKTTIDAKTYDSTKPLDENKAAVDAVIDKLKNDISTEWTKKPTGIEKADPSGETSADGKITGVDDTMEYSTDGGDTWKPVEEGATEIKDLPSGDVQIRRKGLSENRPAGEVETVTIKYVNPNPEPITDPTASYTVEFISKGDVVKTYNKVLTGSLIAEPAKPDIAGFDGWYKDEACTDKWDFDVDTVKADTKIYAKYVETVTITLDANGGTFADGTETSIEAKINQKLNEKTLEEIAANASYGPMVFSGWYKDEYSATPWDFNKDVVTESTTLYIGWGYPVAHEDDVVADISVTRVNDYIYTGKKITPAVSVSFGGKVLVPGVDYTVTYKNNVNAYTSVSGNNLIIDKDGRIDSSNVDTAKAPTIIIKGKKNYSNKKIALNFNILPVVLGDNADTLAENVSADICDNYSTNKKSTIKVKGTVAYKGKKLKAKDYTLTLVPEDAKDASGNPLPKEALAGRKIPKGASGTFKLTVAGKANYKDGFVKTITVTDGAKTLQKAKIKVKKIPYSGNDLSVEDLLDTAKGKLTVKLGKKTLTYGTDYTVEFADNNAKAGSRTNGGVYPILIKGKGDYVGTRMANVTVNGISIKKAAVTLKEVNPTYTGSHIGANIKAVSVNGIEKGLTAGIDYDVVVKNDVNAGKASVTIKGKGIYSGTKKVSYKIQKVKLTKEMFENVTIIDDVINLGNYDYRGGVAITPNVSISYNGVRLINPADYSISLKNNKKAVCTAKATIKGKGNYTGNVNAIFTIGEDKISTEKINIKKAKVRVNTQEYTGRDITISANDIKSAKITVKVGNKKESKNLTLGTDYEIISYVKNVNVGRAQFIIKGIGEYDGYKLVSFKITKKDLKWWQKKLQ